MNLDTSPASRHEYRGEVNLISSKYFPNEDRRTFILTVIHGPLYKPTCNSCQAGVNGIKQAFDFLDRGFIVWNQNIIEQTQQQVVVEVGSYRRSFQLGRDKVCVVPVEPTLQNLIGWFHQTFKGQLELAHTNILSMNCENEGESLGLGY